MSLTLKEVTFQATIFIFKLLWNKIKYYVFSQLRCYLPRLSSRFRSYSTFYMASPKTNILMKFVYRICKIVNKHGNNVDTFSRSVSQLKKLFYSFELQ